MKWSWPEDGDRFIDYLYSLAEEKYREFTNGIVNGKREHIGIRIPILKTIAKEIAKSNYEDFLALDIDRAYEAVMVKLLVIANIKDIDIYKYYFDKYISIIDDWSLCDTFLAASKVIRKDRVYFFSKAKKLLATSDEFFNRIAFVMILDYFVEKNYLERIFKLIDGYKSDKYYANMALAWLISVLYIKYPDETKVFLETCKIDEIVKGYAIRKIKDSYRVSLEDKNWLKKIG